MTFNPLKISSLSVSLGLAVLAGFSTNAYAAAEISFCTEDKDQAPYVLGDGTSLKDTNPGLSIDIVELAAKRVGSSATFMRAPWKRCLALMEKGEVDGVFMGSFKKDRMKLGAYPMADGNVDPSRRLTMSSYSLYRLKGSAPTWDGKAYSGIDGKVGAPLGYSIVKDLTKHGLKVEESKGTPTDFKKLEAKRIVAVAAQTTTGDQLMESGDFPNIEKVETPLVTKPYYVLLSNQLVAKDAALADSFWKAVGDIRENEGKTLIKKYK